MKRWPGMILTQKPDRTWLLASRETGQVFGVRGEASVEEIRRELEDTESHTEGWPMPDGWAVLVFSIEDRKDPVKVAEFEAFAPWLFRSVKEA
jgi:hypothetical protein